ncbi:alpha/beta-hydrolase domain-containing protein [Vairimorpha necatrix]|uniref:Alpha/beta-hydrolase domain-containing protein n=1 Tax=Vairimorpha necatrix TaxID=6039 RepID=A0AAX4JFM8_9MICR
MFFIKSSLLPFFSLFFFFLFFHSLFLIFVFQRHLVFKCSSYTSIPIHCTYKSIDLFYINNHSNTDIIFCHGSIISQKIFKRLLYEMSSFTNCNVLSFNIKGIFNNRGIPSERGIKKELDHIIDYIRQTNTKKVFFGQSLGCSLAIYLSKLIEGRVILENPFRSYKEVVRRRRIWRHIAFLLVDKWENKMDKVEECLFLLSSEDKIVRNEDGEYLSRQCKKSKIRYLKGSTHFNSAKNKNYYKFINEYIQE